MNRREFLKQTGAIVGGVASSAVAFDEATNAARQIDGPGSIQSSAAMAIVVDPTDAVATAPAARWALAELREALLRRRVSAQVIERISDVPRDLPCLVAGGSGQPKTRELLAAAGVEAPTVPESLALTPAKPGGRAVVLACGHDQRGLAYALLELADRVRYAERPLEAFALRHAVVEQPANRIRGNMRLFASDVEDKTWYYDRDFWRRYLSMLASERFNRFNLALGLGYDFPSGIRDAYFHFAYPFLVAVPGYEVRATGVSDAERDRNLEMLRFISDEAAVRGLHFQLGIWTHAYKWINSPHANHTIEGLTPEKHSAYCRDALRELLVQCPAIHGVTFRVHGESGVAEGNYTFWKTLFEGLVQSGRRVEIDMHAKGMDAEMIDVALATGMPVTISPKFWAEHMGLPYHQAGIRPTEKPPRGRKDEGFFSRSSGSRSFLRYGYGDLLVEGRRYGVLHRVWPGTQRLLLWGDPLFAAAYGRVASFCGSAGMELFEPLSFKGRKGSGLPGGRDAYADISLKQGDGDFEKYRYGYRLWGRLLYNPNAQPETWQRMLVHDFGRGAGAVESALASASRILPLITTAHTPSAANNNFWPEIYTNMAIVDPNRPHPYGDTLSPKRFGTVSPLDPQLFARVDDFADSLVKGEADWRYSPLEVGEWLLALADASASELTRATKWDSQTASFRRLAVDVSLQSLLGQFFARKLRAAVLYALNERTGAPRFLRQALAEYRHARQAWAQLSGLASGVYVKDITFGLDAQLRGQWQDRLPAIDEDIADIEKRLSESPAKTTADIKNQAAIDSALRLAFRKSKRPFASVKHVPPQSFQRGQTLTIQIPAASQISSLSATLLYRHTNQAEEFCIEPMIAQSGSFQAVIPAAYTDAPFPLQYYFGFRNPDGRAWMHPGLGPNLNQQPYYVVRPA